MQISIPDSTSPNPESDDFAAKIRRVEAVLFLAREPLSSRRISQLAGLADGTEARTIIGQLNQKYDQMGRAFQVKPVAGGFQMLTRPQFANWLRRLEHIPRRHRMTGPAMETLTVVAYRQPITKADIEAIRGVGCGEMLRQLLEKGLIRIAGRSQELGRPFLYGTTNRFLSTFGFRSLADLPVCGQLSGQGLPKRGISAHNSGHPIFEEHVVPPTSSQRTKEDQS